MPDLLKRNESQAFPLLSSKFAIQGHENGLLIWGLLDLSPWLVHRRADEWRRGYCSALANLGDVKGAL